MSKESSNLDSNTVRGFGDEWDYFDQSSLTQEEQSKIFHDYFGIFPWETLPQDAKGFDLGCGSGRWAQLVSERIGQLSCIDASEKALNVSKRNLLSRPNVDFILASVDSIPLPDGSQDFGYSLGVLHHVPDTLSALKSCVKKLKPGAPFLIYLYYVFDNRPVWYRALWRVTDYARRFICTLPEPARRLVTDLIALTVYLPLARLSLLMERMGLDNKAIPLSYYRNTSFYTMRTDSRDRFGTRLEQRFSRKQIEDMMHSAGLKNIEFSQNAPYWCAVGTKK